MNHTLTAIQNTFRLRIPKQCEAIEMLGRQLVQRPIYHLAYGSEAAFMKSFSQIARNLFGSGRSKAFSAETRLLCLLSEWYGQQQNSSEQLDFFCKNMAILSIHFYSLPGSNKSDPWQRLNLSEMIAHFGMRAVKTSAKRGTIDHRLQRTHSSLLRQARPKGQWLTHLLPGELKYAFKDALGFISPYDLNILGFPSISVRWARSHLHRQRLSDFYERIVLLNDRFECLPKRPCLWELALEINQNDASEALEMLGGIVAQIAAPLRYVEKEIMPRYPDATDADTAFEKAAKTYYLMALLHEKSMLKFAQSALYPEEIHIKNAKFWHFYAAALLANRLHIYAPDTVSKVGFIIGVGYEASTFLTVVNFLAGKRWLHRVTDSLIDAMKDVHRHLQGNKFGRQSRPLILPTTDPN